jgi:dihydrofolate reductase
MVTVSSAGPDAPLVTSTGAIAEIDTRDAQDFPTRPVETAGPARSRCRTTNPSNLSRQESTMTATYTFDVFATLDGYGSYDEHGDWGGFWGKQGPEFLDRRLAQYETEQRLVLGANTFRQFQQLLGPVTPATELDPLNARMVNMPTTVVSTTLEGPLDWPDATLVSGDAVDVVARLKEDSEVPLRSHGSLSMNWALMAAGLVDRIQLTIFPVITGRTGDDPVFQGAADFDLELVEARTLDSHIQELVYRPTLHG